MRRMMPDHFRIFLNRFISSFELCGANIEDGNYLCQIYVHELRKWKDELQRCNRVWNPKALKLLYVDEIS
jgi:hypothetical protein